MPQLGLVLDCTKDSVDEGLERSEVTINSIDLNGVLGRIRLRSLLGAILPLILSSLWRNRMWLCLLSLALLLRRSGCQASRSFFYWT